MGERYQLIKGICDGLLHLHEKRILHLDLKPSNILVDEHMLPKIADFGLSRCLGKEQTRDLASNQYGSMGFLAPEWYRREFTFASDIYSLGVVIMEILTGVKGYPKIDHLIKDWTTRLEGSDQWDTELTQVRVCTKIGIECMDLDPKNRPTARDIVERITSSVEQQVTFLEGQKFHEKIANLPCESMKKLQVKMEELAQHVGTSRVEDWKQGQEVLDSADQWGEEDTMQNVSPQGASISTSKSGVLYRLTNLDIFRVKKPFNNFVKNGGPTLQARGNLRIFSKLDLKEILKAKNVISKDGFGEVYRGTIIHHEVYYTGTSRHELVAVRNPIGATVAENEKFTEELMIQVKRSHMNISSPIGCCLEVDIPILVYEFSSKGSLHDNLHGNNKVPLGLGTRLRIAAYSAHGLDYMLSGPSGKGTKILHGDVKTENIFLDESFNPMVSHFGMSRLYRRTGILVNDVAYKDPVYLQTGLLIEQSDVYSFGVVILELISRKKATQSNNNRLVSKFLDNHKHGRRSTELFDKEIAVTGHFELLDSLAGIAVECLDDDTSRRLTMSDVAKRLFILYRSQAN